MGSWVLTSYLVSRVPLAMVAVPESPDWLATQLLWAPSAMTGPGPMPPGAVQLVVPAGSPSQCTCRGVARSVTSAELVADPPGPVAPWVETLRGPDGEGAELLEGQMTLKMAAG